MGKILSARFYEIAESQQYNFKFKYMYTRYIILYISDTVDLTLISKHSLRL